MSKSKGNVISPDTYIKTYGSDIFRLYLMFGFSYTEGGPWNDDGIKSIAKFLDRIERLTLRANELKNKDGEFGAAEKELNYARNYAILNVNKDMEIFSFNTAIARLMEYVNAIYKYDALDAKINASFLKDCVKDLLLMLAPFTPHFAEELWSQCGNRKSIFLTSFPEADASALVKDEIEYAVQINSKMKCKIVLSKDDDETTIKEKVLSEPKIVEATEGKNIAKIIIIPNRLINIICK